MIVNHHVDYYYSCCYEGV